MHSDWGIEIFQCRWQHGEKVGYCYSGGLEKILFKWDIQGVPLATETGISLIILTPMKILQRNLNRSTFVVWEMWRHHNMCWKWPSFTSKRFQELLLTWLYRFFFPISANNKHSLLQSIPIHFPTILCELTHYTETHEQQPYCVGTLSQMTERLAERRVRQETGWLAGGPLLRVSTTRCTTDTFLFISHTAKVLLFKFRCNIFIGVRIIKEMPGSAASGTPCVCPAGHEKVKDKINFTSARIVRASSYKLIFLFHLKFTIISYCLVHLLHIFS